VLKLIRLYQKYKAPVLYSAGSVAKAIAQMLVGFVIAKFVTPGDFGLWNTINLALVYSLFLQAGLINGLNRELPYLFGKGSEQEAVQMAGTVQTFTFFAIILVIIGGAVCLFVLPVENPRIFFGGLAVLFIIVFNYYQNYLFSTFRSKDSFLVLSKIQFVHAFVNVATLVFVFYFSYYGMLVKAVVVSLVYTLLLHWFRPVKVSLLWNKAAFLKLLKVGLPIFSMAYLEAVAATADKLWIIKYSNVTDVGLYAFGFYALSSFIIFPSSIASYIYPKMTYNYGKTHDKLILWRYVKKITLILLVVLTPIAVLGYFICPRLIAEFFPNYVASTPIMQILLFAGVFSGAVIGVNALWSLKAWKYMIIYQLFFSVLLVVFPYIGIHLFENKLAGVSWGILAAHALNLVSGICMTYLATHDPKITDPEIETEE
jgi:O-antigen/teichoic acid export membrane protein